MRLILERIGGFREFGDHLAIWKGTVVDKAVRVLAIRGTAMTPEDLVAAIGEGNPVRALRNRMLEDRRLARVTKNEWALRAWGLAEYTGIADKIAEEIDRQGGATSLSNLVDLYRGTVWRSPKFCARVRANSPVCGGRGHSPPTCCHQASRGLGPNRRRERLFPGLADECELLSRRR